MVIYEPERRREVANLLSIAAGFSGPPEELAVGVAAGGGSALGRLVTEAVNEGLRRQREQRATDAADPAQLRAVPRAGNAAAVVVVERTLGEVRRVMSMDY